MGSLLKMDCVLCATDFSPASAAALRYAACVAKRFNARLYFLHILGAAGPTAGEAESDRLRRRAEREATEKMRQLGAGLLSEQNEYVIAAVAGDPAARIVQKARDVDADLIVIGAPGERIALRSASCVADEVLRRAACPVLTVHESEEQAIHEAWE